MLFFYIVFAIFLFSDLPPLIIGRLKKETIIYCIIAAGVGISAGIYYMFFIK